MNARTQKVWHTVAMNDVAAALVPILVLLAIAILALLILIFPLLGALKLQDNTEKIL